MRFSSRIAFVVLMIMAVAPVAAAAGVHYHQTNLVSDIAGLAAHTDHDLVNAWGLARGGTSPWWVNDNGTSISQLYTADGAKVMPQFGGVSVPAVNIPPIGTSAPTGIVFNSDTTATDFVVSEGTKSGRAAFIFATEDGTISGWNPSVDLANAIQEIPQAGVTPTAVYKGLAIATHGNATFLYATNFTGGKVEVYDSSWALHDFQEGGFVDTAVPSNYHPFNVQNLGGNLFVTFAQFDGSKDEVHGRGFGFVDEFDSAGNLLRRFQHGPWLNAPWGLAMSPAGFGQFSNNLLVGNFGSGEIAAFDPNTGEFLGRLHSERGVLVIDGLWAIAFGGGNTTNGPLTTLFFTAGPNDESDGLFGTLTAISKKKHDHDD
jgi:uncharacterized protein (TIGR03118 family)